MVTTRGRGGLGWIPDYPDFRDYTEGTEEVTSVLGPTGALKAKKLPASVDLREHCSPVEDPGGLGCGEMFGMNAGGGCKKVACVHRGREIVFR